MASIGDFLNKLQKVRRLSNGEYTACCPAHEDKHPSLTVRLVEDKILVNCHKGCSMEQIIASLGMETSDLSVSDPKPPPSHLGKVTATYDYKDELGQPLFQVVRYDPKSFRQRHKNGAGEWVWDMEGVRRVLYHLPEVLDASEVYVTEGEKDADNLWAWGKVATTSPGGASAWHSEYAIYLKGKDVVIVPDNDAPGLEYARQVAQSIKEEARSVQVLIAPPPFKDISDWLEREGGKSDWPEAQDIKVLFNPEAVLYRLSEEAIEWNKVIAGSELKFQAEKVSEERTGIHARISIALNGLMLSWGYLNVERGDERVRLSNAAHSQIKGETSKAYGKDDMRRDLDLFCADLWDYKQSLYMPEIMAGNATIPLVFLLRPYVLQGGGTLMFSPPGRGKSYTLLIWAVSIDAGLSAYWPVKQEKVLIINLERSRDSLRRRLGKINRVLGLPEGRPIAILNARGKSLSEVMASCKRYIAEKDIGLVMLDSISRAGLGDLNENMPMNRVIDALSSLCPTWVALAHTSRASEEHAYGSIMQDAGADICVQLTSQIIESNNGLAIGLAVPKQNDLGYVPQQIFELGFDSEGLTGLRKAKPGEFSEIEESQKISSLTQVIDFILNSDSGDATATEIEEALGIKRATISKLFTKSGRFIPTRKVRHSVYYGIKTQPG